MNEIEKKAGLPSTAGYIYAKRIKNQLYISRQVPHDASGNVVGENDPYKQTNQCLTNLELLLKTHSFDTSDIQRMVIYVVGDRKNLTIAWSAVNAMFPNGVPPATLLGSCHARLRKTTCRN